jgi:topoisomerase-4 subunit A
MNEEPINEITEYSQPDPPDHGNGRKLDITHLPGMYENWFLEYASYVILERAVPYLYDGLKPVQRRILYSMRRLEDGRYNKVANIIGHTMQFHPHGDVSIGDALVQLGQKDLLIDCQGNWGNILTGDNAAASRYIEARLSKFALEVVFNPKTTQWKSSYDGRNKEPVYLPVKFPLLPAMGVEGIAVGLASKVLPHNFNELIDASIACLKDEPFVLLPDFPTGGMADCSKYNDGQRGGKVRIRAKISKLDKKTLVINEIPYGKTTSTLIDSILLVNDKGKIKIRKIDDNTAGVVEILIHLTPGVSPDKTMDALYAFTDCEVPISPNTCVINDGRPVFLGVSDILRISTANTVELLRQELLIRKEELESEWHTCSLEKIFIENRIYITIENCETWEDVLTTIDKGLDPFKHILIRPVTQDDLVMLTELKIKRISKYDAKRAQEQIAAIEKELAVVNHHLENLIVYAINYFENLRKKYGADYPRKTEIRSFDNIEASKVVVANEKLYANFEEGFIGTSLKKDAFLFDCSDIDDIIIFRKDGTFLVTKVSTKAFVGKNILHIALFNKNNERTIFNVVYRDGKAGFSYAKRFAVKGVTRDKEYDITQGKEGSKIQYFTENPNGESEVIRVSLKPKPKLKKPVFDFDFGTLAIKNRNAMGNIVSKHTLIKISLKEKGTSTLGGLKIWFDNSVNRLNTDGRGQYLGEFEGEDQILVLLADGQFRLSNYDIANHFEENIIRIEKFNPYTIFTVVLLDAEQKFYYLKRFQIETDTPENKLNRMIGDHPDSRMLSISDQFLPRFEITFGGKHSLRPPEIIDAAEFIGLKSFKAKGKRLTTFEVDTITEIEAIAPDDETLLKYYGPEFAELLGRVNEPDENEEPDENDDAETIEEADGEVADGEAADSEAADSEAADKIEADQEKVKDPVDTEESPVIQNVEDIPFEVEIATGDENTKDGKNGKNGKKGKRGKNVNSPDPPVVDDSGQLGFGW